MNKYRNQLRSLNEIRFLSDKRRPDVSRMTIKTLKRRAREHDNEVKWHKYQGEGFWGTAYSGERHGDISWPEIKHAKEMLNLHTAGMEHHEEARDAANTMIRVLQARKNLQKRKARTGSTLNLEKFPKKMYSDREFLRMSKKAHNLTDEIEDYHHKRLEEIGSDPRDWVF